MSNPLAIYTSRRMFALALIGFSSGLPLLLTTAKLQQWMKDIDVDLATIGYLNLVTLPYVLKVLWSPLMDRYRVPFLGPRRGWLLVTQLLLMAAIGGLAFVGSAGLVGPIAMAALTIAVLSASQDIVADGYRTDLLRPHERGYGASMFVTGYRLAMVAAGMGASVLVGEQILSWPAAYALMAGLMLIGIAGTFLALEPDAPPPAPPTLVGAVWPPLREFLSRPDGVLVLIFVTVFRLPDSLAAGMTVPFLKELGVTNTQLGVIRDGIGLGVTILGALAGGLVVDRLKLRGALWLFGILQAASNVGFLVLAYTGNKLGVLVTVVVVENFCAGLFVAGFFAFLMSQCNARFTVTQYALLSSVMALAGNVLAGWTGVWAKHLGWPGFFWLTIAAAVPGLLLLAFIRPQDHAKPDAALA